MFRAGTGMLGATEPNQKVTPENIGQLPAGSVVQLEGDAVLIHLHDGLWYWRDGCAWCYNTADRFYSRLEGAELCHIPASPKTPAADLEEVAREIALATVSVITQTQFDWAKIWVEGDKTFEQGEGVVQQIASIAESRITAALHAERLPPYTTAPAEGVLERIASEFQCYWDRHFEEKERASAHPVTEVEERVMEIINTARWATTAPARCVKCGHQVSGSRYRTICAEGLIGECQCLCEFTTAPEPEAVREIYQCLENLCGDLYLIDVGEIKQKDMDEGSRQDALKALAKFQHYRREKSK